MVVAVQVALVGVLDLGSTNIYHVERWLLIEIPRRTVVVLHKTVVVHRNSMKNSGSSTKTVIVYRKSTKNSGNSTKSSSSI